MEHGVIAADIKGLDAAADESLGGWEDIGGGGDRDFFEGESGFLESGAGDFHDFDGIRLGGVINRADGAGFRQRLTDGIDHFLDWGERANAGHVGEVLGERLAGAGGDRV